MPGRRWESASLEPPVRPADPAVRNANARRIVTLFRRYKPKLAAACGLILFSAAIGVMPPFLLRDVLDTAIQVSPSGEATVDMNLLVWLVAGMVAIPVVSGAVMVYVTLLSNRGKRHTRASMGAPPGQAGPHPGKLQLLKTAGHLLTLASDSHPFTRNVNLPEGSQRRLVVVSPADSRLRLERLAAGLRCDAARERHPLRPIAW